jgi:hypothetical protein
MEKILQNQLQEIIFGSSEFNFFLENSNAFFESDEGRLVF